MNIKSIGDHTIITEGGRGMYYMFDEKLKIAYEKSDEVVSMLDYREDQMISTQEIIQLIKNKYCPEINISFASFSQAGIDEPYGAMMKTELDNKTSKTVCADIILNSDNDAAFQRFSLLHELGHLVAHAWKPSEEITMDMPNKYVVSTHIDYKITTIKKDEYEKDGYLENEQIANVFALRVLMPSKQFYKRIKEYNNISDVARFFGVSEEAVISRMMIGA